MRKWFIISLLVLALVTMFVATADDDGRTITISGHDVRL